MAEPKVRFRRDDGSSYSEWNDVVLGDIATRVTRKNSNGETDRPLTIASIEGLVDQRTYFGKTIASKDMSGYFLLKKGEYAYNKSYSAGYDYGSIKRLDKYDMGALSTLYICFALNEDQNTDFYDCYFNGLSWYNQMPQICAEGARNHGLLNVSPNDFFKIRLSVPSSKEEQQKIADFLSSVDEVITTSEQEVANLETQKKAVMKKIFSQEVRFKREDGSDFPEWKERKLGDLGKATGGVGFPEKYQGYKDLQVPFYKVSDMNLPGNEISMSLANNYVSDELLRQMKSKPFVDTAVIFAKVGAAVFLDRKRIAYPPFLVDNNMMVFTPSCNDIDFQFLYHWFVSIKLSTFAQTGALPSYNASDIETINVCYPCLKEQRLIADFLSDFDEAIAAAKKELELWKELKKGLLRQMFV